MSPRGAIIVSGTGEKEAHSEEEVRRSPQPWRLLHTRDSLPVNGYPRSSRAAGPPHPPPAAGQGQQQNGPGSVLSPGTVGLPLPQGGTTPAVAIIAAATVAAQPYRVAIAPPDGPQAGRPDAVYAVLARLRDGSSLRTRAPGGAIKRGDGRLVAACMPWMAAVGACMRKLLMIAYRVLKNRTPFDPHGRCNSPLDITPSGSAGTSRTARTAASPVDPLDPPWLEIP
jgi:hypothetical protein